MTTTSKYRPMMDTPDSDGHNIFHAATGVAMMFGEKTNDVGCAFYQERFQIENSAVEKMKLVASPKTSTDEILTYAYKSGATVSVAIYDRDDRFTTVLVTVLKDA